MGSIHEKKKGRKSRDTAPLNHLPTPLFVATSSFYSFSSPNIVSSFSSSSPPTLKGQCHEIFDIFRFDKNLPGPHTIRLKRWFR